MDNIIDMMKDAATFASLPAEQRIAGGLVVTGLGMGITFLVLIILIYSVQIMAAAFNKKAAPQTKAAPAATVPVVAGPSAEPLDDETTAAIITAISFLEGGKSFTIKNIYAPPQSAQWMAQARMESLQRAEKIK